jgi:hypothetical protein
MNGATDRLRPESPLRPYVWVGVAMLAVIALISCHDVILGPDHHDSARCSLCHSLSHAVLALGATAVAALLLLVTATPSVSFGALTRAPHSWRSRAPPAGFISSIC